MVEHTLWHPVLVSTALKDAPVAARLLGQDVVLWRDDHQRAHAWADRCPHRGAKLSLGRVCEGKLECPYHGWRFDASARCTQVPAMPGFVPPAHHEASAFLTTEAYGLVWVNLQRPGAVGTAALPHFEAEADGRLRKVLCGPYTVETSAPRIVENFLDMAHFGFVHEGSLGSRLTTEVTPYQVQCTATGLIATGCKAWQPQSNLHSTAPAQVEYSYEVTAPYCAVLTKVPDADTVALADYREAIGLFICPVEPTLSQVWFNLAVADFESPDPKLQDFQHMIFMQDKPVLESQVPACLPLDPRAELHTAADKASAAYRRYLLDLNITFGVC